MTFESDWSAWHAERERAAGAEYGPASLESTNWLISEPAAVEGIPGLWAVAGEDSIRGTDLGVDGATVTLRRGQALRLGRRELRLFRRRENTALRVFNPARPQRERFSAIDTYRPDPAWRLPAVFEPAIDETITVTSIDGAQHEEAIAGRLRFALRGVPHELTATRSAGALHVVFGDGTNGVETYRFRFLTIDEPAADGTTVVDFTRAYLPPCAFSDQFVCPRPHEGNRFAASIRAGERAVVLGR